MLCICAVTLNDVVPSFGIVYEEQKSLELGLWVVVSGNVVLLTVKRAMSNDPKAPVPEPLTHTLNDEPGVRAASCVWSSCVQSALYAATGVQTAPAPGVVGGGVPVVVVVPVPPQLVELASIVQ